MNSYDINLEKVPTHIAIIMDGNGRWAKSRFLPRTAGHKAGVEAIREVIISEDNVLINFFISETNLIYSKQNK